MSDMDGGSSLRWLSPTTMTLCHHFDSASTSDPVPQNLSQVKWVYMYKAAAVCPLTAYQCAQRLFICLMWMQKAVWVGCQPQQWHYAIILTPQVTQTPNYEPRKVDMTVWGYCHMAMDSISMFSNTLYVSNVNMGISLSWRSASTMM